MTRARDDLSFEAASEALAYDPLTGALSWKRRTANGLAAGSPAGTSRGYKGYVVISLGRRTYRAHRLAWLLAHGQWPKGEVDHINRVRSDNRLENLRDVPRSINGHNGGVRAHSSSGVRGVQQARSGRWVAQIRVAKQYHYLGTFETVEDAAAAYASARRHLIPGIDEARP